MNQSHPYDDVPYPDLCYPYTHPGRIAAIATLLGLQPAPVENCRVLEIGCAGGGNLIPMAYGLPNSTFTGIDNSARQIKAAQVFARALALDNIEFQTMDLLDITSAFGQFDYIIAHGMYAWVPPHVQDKILSICQQNLSPQGVAYISYNTLPGWSMILMARDMMLYHVRNETDPQTRAQLARDFITDLANMLPDGEQSAYRAFLKTYADIRFNRFNGHPGWEESSLLHDELGPFNQPVLFHQFIEHGAKHGLQYLAEADFSQVMTHDLPDHTTARLQTLASDIIEREQYLDFVRNQTFRRTLLCHDSIALNRTLSSESVRDMFMMSRAQPGTDSDGDPQFQTPDGSTYPAEDPLTAAALHHLSAISPRAMAFDELLQRACAMTGVAPTDEQAAALAGNLLEAFTYSAQIAELLTYDPSCAVEVPPYPQISPVARQQGRSSRIVSNLRHEQVELDGLNVALLPFLDGQHNRDDLLRELVGLVESGKLSPSRRISDPQQMRQQLAQYLDHALHWLVYAALLVE
ncbi:MAG: hypothetical protein CL610_24815 [Anaerolineaceae bacterium]|nr:hypothetical protein [Anaerolineaceae bacterium]